MENYKDIPEFSSTKNDNAFYKENIEAMFKTHSTVRVPNGAPEHARIIFEAMLTNAKNNVKIFCRNLSSNVFNSTILVKALKEALERGVAVMVFTQEEPSEHEFTETLKSHAEATLLKLTATKYINEETNFAIMDDCAFRYEPNRDVISAIACANEPDTCAKLKRNFLKLEQSLCNE